MLNDDKNDEINIGMNNEDDESIQSLISDKSVKLLGLTADDVEASGPLIFKERESNVERFEFPMMPFPNPLFYQSRDFLYIYEMRFRTLMNDVESIYSNSLGRIFVTDEGAVGKIGTVCSVVQKRRLQDGKGFFIIEATPKRFKIRRITKRQPYLVAEVELIEDDRPATPSVRDENEVLCREIYALLKTYLRLARVQVDKAREEEEIVRINENNDKSDAINVEIIDDNNDSNDNNNDNVSSSSYSDSIDSDDLLDMDDIAATNADGAIISSDTDVSKNNNNIDSLWNAGGIDDQGRQIIGLSNGILPTGSSFDIENDQSVRNDEYKDEDEDEDDDDDDDAMLSDEEEEAEVDDLVLSQAVIKNRPLYFINGKNLNENLEQYDDDDDNDNQNDDGDDGESDDEKDRRHSFFSQAVASTLSTEPKLMQILLQEQSINFRLKAVKIILKGAVEELSLLLIEAGIIFSEEVDSYLYCASQQDDDDSDLIPLDITQGEMTLQSELSPALVAQLGLAPEDLLVAAPVDTKALQALQNIDNGTDDKKRNGDDEKNDYENKEKNDDIRSNVDIDMDTDIDFDDDIWDGEGAFQ